MSDYIHPVNFANGEPVEPEDFNQLQTIIEAKLRDRAFRMGAMAGALNMGLATGQGADMSGQASMSASRLYTPDPLNFVETEFYITGAGELRFAYGQQILAQGYGANTPGTVPVGTPSHLSGLVVSLDDDEIGAVPGAFAPATNPRFDSLGVRLGYAVGGSETRDSEDAVTRELTDGTFDKEQQVTIEYELIQGAEAASPVLPAHTAGFARFMAVRREVGETSLNPDNVELHTFPTKLKCETIWGRDCGYDETGSGFHEGNSGHFGMAIRQQNASAEPLIAMSRQMHEGHRLVGVAVCFDNMTVDVDVRIATYITNTGGGSSTPTIQNIGDGNPMGSSGNGIHYVGIDDFNQPIWGNGKTRGPIAAEAHRQNPAEQIASSRLGILMGSVSPWNVGSIIQYVKLYYLE